MHKGSPHADGPGWPRQPAFPSSHGAISRRSARIRRHWRSARRTPVAPAGAGRDDASIPIRPLKERTMASPLDIAAHTPTAVWAVLAGLVLMGLRQTKTQTLSALRVWIVPAVVGAASLAGALRGFAGAGELLTGACWAVGAGLGFVSNRSLDLPRRVDANADGSFTIGGSIAPLLLFVGVFMVRYVVNVALALQPSLSGNPQAAAIAAIAYGFTAGLLAARSRKIWASRGNTGTLLSA